MIHPNAPPPYPFLQEVDVTAKYHDFVTGHDECQYDKLPFQSSFHEKISTTLLDTEKTKRIWEAYTHYVLPSIKNEKVTEVFENWLEKHLFLLGCQQEDLLSKVRTIAELSPFLTQFQNFFSAVSCKEHSHHPTSHPPHVVIVTTSGAGGELMVATAMHEYLQSISMPSTVLDVREVIKGNNDILYRFTGEVEVQDIWGEIMQKRNDPELAGEIYWKTNQLRQFIPDNSADLLKKAIRQLNPDLIITTQYYSPKDAALAYDLNVPVRFVHCDYHFAPELEPIARVVDTKLVKFWVPTVECVPTELQNRVEVLGYPIRMGIQKVDTKKTLDYLKKKMGILPDQKVVMMMMGRKGMSGMLLPLIKQINNAGSSLDSLHVAIICGKNSEMKREISEYIKHNKTPSGTSFHVYGYLGEKQMSDYYNVAHVFLGKAGGCTTSELIHMKVYGLMCKSYELEVPNLAHLVKIGLGEQLDPNRFVEQLQKFLRYDKNAISLTPVNWQQKIDGILSATK